ncbi:MAG: trypsin-like peptidase domain-containing protein [Dehalococcoidia bacterium]|nr:trypsin-like peptidase domain-containing protein [Dehalococcoidia bacterium]
MKRIAPIAASSVAALTLLVGVACSENSARPQDANTAATATTPATQDRDQTQTSRNPGAEMTTSEVVKLAEPSVVRIESGTSVGSGFIVDSDGYIITNNHVVAGQFGRAANVRVTLSDGSDYDATVVGTDPRSDLALLKIDADHALQALSLANLDDVQIGEDVVAIGYALDLDGGEGPSFSVTRGIVSQKNRGIQESSPILGAVQTDAAINHGNSGGPLLNMRAEVVGVNTALQPDSTSPTGIAQGIGYAVGSDMVRAVFEELKADGQVTRGLLGVRGFEALRPAKARELGVPEGQGGVYLPRPNEFVAQNAVSVEPGGPADAAGIQPGDVITKIDGAPIRSEGDLAIAMIKHAPEVDVEVEIYRDGQPQTIIVRLGAP